MIVFPLALADEDQAEFRTRHGFHLGFSLSTSNRILVFIPKTTISNFVLFVYIKGIETILRLLSLLHITFVVVFFFFWQHVQQFSNVL